MCGVDGGPASLAFRPFACFSTTRRQFGSFSWFSKKKSLPEHRSSYCDGCRKEHATGKMSSRQQWNFSPPVTGDECEEYKADLPSATGLELSVRPDISGGETRASLESLKLSVPPES